MKSSKLRFIVLSAGLILLTACASWRADHSLNSADSTDASDVQSSGLNDGILNSEDETDNDEDNAQNKFTYYFAFNKSDLRYSDQEAIAENARYLREHPQVKALIEGHTDPRGSREYNIALGERRAQAIAVKLIAEGVKADRIKTISYGSEKLATSGHSQADYQLDRRGIVVYLTR